MWEDKFAYSRIKRAGTLIETVGTIKCKTGKVHAPNDIYQLIDHSFEFLKNSFLDQFHERENVIRAKAYATDISRATEVGKAHAEYFKGIDPVMTLVEVKRSIVPEALVEIK